MNLLIYTLCLFVFIAIKIPISFSLVLSSAVYLAFLTDLDFIILPQQMIAGVNSFPFIACPLFVLLGEFMHYSGATLRLVNMSRVFVGHIRGSLAHISILTSMLMAGIQGAAISDAAAVGSILIPAMKKDGYPANFAAALIAAASVLGPIIPPSISFVIYGSLGNVSIGRLFLGGFFPGVLVGIFLMIYSYIIARGEKYRGTLTPFELKSVFPGLRQGMVPMVIPIIVVGGIIGGLFTPTESSAIAALVALFLGVVIYRKIGRKEFLNCLLNTVYMLGSLVFLLGASATFGWIITIEGGAQLLADGLRAITDSPLVMMLMINALLFFLGLFVEAVPLIIMLTPILLPITTKMGYDPVHFGVIMTLNATIGLTSPPVGACIFVTCKLADVSIDSFTRAIIPLYIPLLLGLLVTILFPELVMFLPNLLMPIH